jgi:hypothetical protein
MTKKEAFTSSKTVHPLITLEKCASTSALVSHVGGLVEWHRYYDHLVPFILHSWIFFLWGFVKDRVLPANVVELQTQITATVAEVMPEKLCIMARN